ncbi:methyltransferase domain-containing protein [Corynebacterium silvaticum]|uniref:Methyltransferase domain-containing protein n=1 Tax=Corynebacterium silvaticum TaxID=2320431 RepID=A0A7U5K8U4_9CORY|nr:methyltransferase domain-containing protein [Corynebacterium silvaticum]ARU45701.1 methyltransferase domain-containing protein [Corynebacterium silvaticum]MBH5299890.1 methyltransferase domain-containing protein [Corynebacterium silvaticum]NOM65780.1 methyltransferase domain-containing protein [Corynebacterium silvaticum]TFA91591.1 class I SAM-dependent methyltransferase [Corynebacterium silvaticum]TFA92547.1 class I SAM-dependent methyltransferase [Corynebacterium silvaticum]
MVQISPVPQSERPTETAAGHWVLARAGKKVLRPGGLKLTTRLLSQADIHGSRIIEFAPGLGRTAKIIVESGVASYLGVEQDPDAAANVKQVVTPYGGKVIDARAQDTGLPAASADVVVGEAMLTMQGEKGKNEIVAEAFRLISPGGCYAIHELGLVPNNIDLQLADALRKNLAKSIRVNARPLTENEWCEVLKRAGFAIEWVGFEPMALLSLRRNLADEGLLGVVRILKNVILDKDLRQRVLAMRSTFSEYQKQLTGIAIIARKPQ